MESYMDQCGKYMKPLVTELLQEGACASFSKPVSLSFNWIRCIPGANGIKNRGYNDSARVPFADLVGYLHPTEQQKRFKMAWTVDRQQKYDQYMKNGTTALSQNNTANVGNSSTTTTNSTASNNAMINVDALVRSYTDATGEANCELNIAAAGMYYCFK